MQSASVSCLAAKSCLYIHVCVIVFLFAIFQGYPGEDNKTPGPPGPLGEPVGLAFLKLSFLIPNTPHSI